MTYANRTDLHKAVKNFLKQRIHAAKANKEVRYDAKAYWMATEITAARLLHQWNAISTYKYYGLCMWVANHHRDFLQVLPSNAGGHRHIRQHMVDLIACCCWLSTLDKQQVDEQQYN
jgi:hypothetical protein